MYGSNHSCGCLISELSAKKPVNHNKPLMDDFDMSMHDISKIQRYKKGSSSKIEVCYLASA